MRGSLFQIFTFIELTATRAEKPELPLQLETAFLTTMYTYFPCFSISDRGLLTIGNSEVLLAAVYKSPGRAWNVADITELLSLSS
jgi:hypothetical protein